MRTSQKYCHKCPHDGKGRSVCLSCAGAPEEFRFTKGVHLGDEIDQIPAPHPPDDAPQRPSAEDDAKDRLRRFVVDFFRLRPVEMLFLQSAMKGQTLSEFAAEFQAFASGCAASPMTRQHAYELREAVLAKIGSQFADILRPSTRR